MRTYLFVIVSFFCINMSAATYTVSNTNTSGAGSLHAAITSANTNPGGPHSIVFNIPQTDPNYDA